MGCVYTVAKSGNREEDLRCLRPIPLLRRLLTGSSPVANTYEHAKLGVKLWNCVTFDISWRWRKI